MSNHFSSYSSFPYGPPPYGTPPSSNVPRTDEWTAQQSLFMGSSRQDFSRQVSFSPQDQYRSASPSPPISNYSTQLTDTSSPFSGRIMYPSSSYQQGNPGFYYDPFQFPHSTASRTTGYPVRNMQTTPTHQVPASSGPVHMCTPLPPVPDPVLHTTDPTSSFAPPDHGSAGHSPPHLPTDTSTDQATILNLNFDTLGHDDPGSFPSRPTTVPQVASCYPLLETKQPVVIKEAKKLSIPYYDPSKLSWSSFALKLHAALIECNLAYLLQE